MRNDRDDCHMILAYMHDWHSPFMKSDLLLYWFPYDCHWMIPSPHILNHQRRINQ